ncbi:hypothetical protein Q9295_00770 [Xinfangfangia sp. CPCC 101601]|uniref:Pilus assembly protein n=1 Tax=Pseudogemmobacter lacusdianii TaxID=3069608 RepID=A0ABU0VT48_9RHOB|nr:hypothetical protein [Xinfangfangia sp. CPCC 101601]MDQ2064892.1 hypothetical protein [Xinfangfangia sp. CPCC 101601]
MPKMIQSFCRSEDGAVTIDWVMITALIVGLQIAVLLTPMREALLGVSGTIADTVTSAGSALQ